MPSNLIKDWLAEYKALPEVELNTYAATIRNNQELVAALYDLFEQELSHESVDPVCHQLFDFYRSGHPDLQRFTLELMPGLILAYLLAISRAEKKRVGGIEACILGIYNLEVVDQHGKPKVKTFTIPTLADHSVYHEPPSLATLALTETSLLRFHSDEPVKITIGPMPQVENINAQNRMSVLTYVMNHYNADIGSLSSQSHQALCSACSKLVKTGFDNLGTQDIHTVDLNESGSSRGSKRGVMFLDAPRVALDSKFIVELLSGVYFAMFNGQARDGVRAVEDTHSRASYELFADVLLVTNAIKNSLEFNPSGQPTDGPMGISIALSPTQGNPTFKKNAITNASFRAKKLPDDIPSPLSDDESALEPFGNELSENPKKFERSESLKSSEGKKMEPKRKTSAAKKERRRSSDSRPAPVKKPENEKKKKDRKSSFAKQEDIEVPEEVEAPPDNPPHYDEVVETTERPKSTDMDKLKSALKMGKPHKGIMKKTMTDKLKIQKKDPDGKKKDAIADSHSPKSPKHSTSMSSALSASYNGDAADPTMVNVQVVRSSSKTVVDHVDLMQVTSDPQHRRTSSYPETSTLDSSASGNSSLGKPVIQPASHSRGLQPGEASSEDSVDTPL